MSKTTKIVAVLVFVGLAVGSALIDDVALSSSHHEGGPTGDHWSLLAQIFPGMIHNAHHLVDGKATFIEGTNPDKIIHVFMALVVVALGLFGGVSIYRRSRKDMPVVPDRRFSMFSLLEGISEAVFGLMTGLMGEDNAKRYFPLIASLAVFILFSNVLGMIPGFLPPTDSLNTPLGLGLTVFVATHYGGVRTHGISYFKHFLGPIVKWYAIPLMVLMLIIETISHIVRPLSLAVRLMGNIMGDHKVLGIFLGFGVLFVPLPVMALGLLVAVVQTLVFCLLSMVYISLAVEEAEGH